MLGWQCYARSLLGRSALAVTVLVLHVSSSIGRVRSVEFGQNVCLEEFAPSARFVKKRGVKLGRKQGETLVQLSCAAIFPAMGLDPQIKFKEKVNVCD